ncbi:MAG TPA: hypothetical protein VGS17_12935 [Candidatus Limnocylindria bacterium]|nr:hypothetical protein [Candidatus Limnocylindria bacterium]
MLLLAQTGHVLEHVAQIHVLGLTGSDARGIVGQLDIEWVRFVWNAGGVVLLGALLVHARSNRWLVAACLFAVWHLVWSEGSRTGSFPTVARTFAAARDFRGEKRIVSTRHSSEQCCGQATLVTERCTTE